MIALYLIFVTAALVVAIPSTMVYFQIQQNRLDREHIAAITQNRRKQEKRPQERQPQVALDLAA
jgi:cell division protein FtsL